jgi:hypothetical protein
MRIWSKLVLVFLAVGCGNAAEPSSESSQTEPSPDGSANAGGTNAGTGGARAAGGSGGSSGHPSDGGSGSRVVEAAAGGSGGSSGGAGNADSGSHIVEACPTADAGGPGVVGVFENVTPPAAGGADITSAVVDPLNGAIVYAGTNSKGLFRSSDCGATWTKINTGLNASKLDTGQMWDLAIDPVDSQVLYSGALYGQDLGLLKSTNGGVDWQTVFPPPEIAPTINFTGVVAVDPTDHAHLLLTLHDQCKGSLNWGCMAESKDSGSTWKLIKVPPPSWSHNASPFPVSGATWLYGAGSDGMFLTEDGGGTWTKVADQAMNQMYRASDGSYYVASLQGVIRAIAVIGDGQHVFASEDSAFKVSQPFHRAPENDPMSWTSIASPAGLYGANTFAYDPDHHILYAPSTSAGLWRMVTY